MEPSEKRTEAVSAGGIHADGLASEITEHQRADAARRASELRYRLLFENNVAAIIRNTLDGRIVECNDATARILGYASPQEMLGLNMKDILCDPEGRVELMARLQSEKTLAGIEAKFRHKDGRPVWIIANVSLTPADDTGETFVQGTLFDITERKRAEEALRESEAGLAAAQRVAHIGSWEWNVETDKAHWSDETFHIFGLAPGRLEEHRQSFLNMIHPQDKARADQALTEAVNGTREYNLDYRIQVPDGTEKVIHAQAETLRDETGRPLRMQGTVQDITEQKRGEEELQRSLEQLRALAGRLQSIREEERKKVAREIHDQLGQALTAIKIDLSSMVHELPAGEDQPAKRAASILQLVDESIRTVRRIATDLRPGILDDLGLVAAIEWAGKDFQARTGTRCRLDLPQDDIAVDPKQATAIFRIFQETLTNVARHADASQVDVRMAREDGHLTLEVHDNGKGISEDELSSRESLGILGMRERAVLLGGELTISGPPGNGTTVRVRIPEARRT